MLLFMSDFGTPCDNLQSTIMNKYMYTSADFSVFNKDYFKKIGINVFEDVCIEGDGSNKRIVVYNSNCDDTVTIMTNINYEMPRKMFAYRTWRITFSQKPIPASHLRTNKHGYFVTYSWYGNLHHFWTETFTGIYGAMKLNGDYKNGELMVSDFHVIANAFDAYNNSKQVSRLTPAIKMKFEPYLVALGATYNDMYTALETDICYSVGTLNGFYADNIETAEVESVLRTRWNITDSSCPGDDEIQILLIARRYRRILNSEPVQRILEATDRRISVQHVYFEDLSLREQIRTVYCSHILIGVQGAGLDNHRFMKRGSGVIEIGWKGWPAIKFESAVKDYGQNYEKIKNCDASVESDSVWANYFQRAPMMRNTTKEAVVKLSDKLDTMDKRNIWKYADCSVNTDELLSKVKRILHAKIA